MRNIYSLTQLCCTTSHEIIIIHNWWTFARQTLAVVHFPSYTLIRWLGIKDGSTATMQFKGSSRMGRVWQPCISYVAHNWMPRFSCGIYLWHIISLLCGLEPFYGTTIFPQYRLELVFFFQGWQLWVVLTPANLFTAFRTLKKSLVYCWKIAYSNGSVNYENGPKNFTYLDDHPGPFWGPAVHRTGRLKDPIGPNLNIKFKINLIPQALYLWSTCLMTFYQTTKFTFNAMVQPTWIHANLWNLVTIGGLCMCGPFGWTIT